MRGQYIATTIIIIVIALMAGGILLNGFLSGPPTQPTDTELIDRTPNAERLQAIASNIISAGPPPDGIPPVETPQYWDVDTATENLLADDIVFGFIHDGVPKAYPQRILVWHEIVNEDGSVSITYCPLTGSAIGYFGNFVAPTTTFGTSGRLVNSNLVMYDRDSNSYFPQILGQGVTGDHFGTKLERFQLYWTTWKAWKTQYPDTLVLSETTGFTRDYNRDPYGSYLLTSSYYNTGGLLFPAMHQDDRLRDKEVVIGIDDRNDQLAIQKSHLQAVKVINYDLDNSSLVAFYDENLDVAHVFSRELNGQTLTFSLKSNNIVDDQDNTWNLDGTSTVTGAQLDQIVYFDVFWAAWIGFFPDTDLVQA